MVDDARQILVALTFALTFLALIPATAHARELRGNRRMWHRLSLALFTAGVVALVTTTPHAVDRATTSASCPLAENRGAMNLQPRSIQAPAVRACQDTIWPFYPARTDRVGFIQVDEWGRVDPPEGSTLEEEPVVVEESPRQLVDRIALYVDQRYGWRLDEEDPFNDPEFSPALEVYADVRALFDGSLGHLRAIRDHRVRYVVLLGQSEERGYLATTGPWKRRRICEIGWISFTDPEYSYRDFETWGEVQTLALELAPEPLRLGL